MLRKTLWVIAIAPLAAGAAELPIFDAHLHYSHDAWESVPPAQAIAMLRKAGVKRALVSSSGDDGLRDVVKHYSELSPDRLHSDGEQILKPLHLTDAGIADLTVFLETLSDRGGRYQRRPFPEDCR